MSSDASKYAAIKYRLILINLVIWFAFLILWHCCGASKLLSNFWEGVSTNQFIVVLGYILVFGLVNYIVKFPTHFFASFHLEHRFGLSRMNIKNWWLRETKQLLVSGLISVLLIEGFYWVLREFPSSWPIWATLGWVGFSIVLARVFPTLILPLFYKTTPLNDEALTTRLLGLCKKSGISALGVFRFDLGAETRKANAALAGIGKTRRVLLADTLIDEFTADEIEGVLAHELGHYKFKHIVKLLVISAVAALIAFYLTDMAARSWLSIFGISGISSIAGFPIVAIWFSLLNLVVMPAQNGISRYFEWQSDHFALDLTNHTNAFARALKRLAELNLADPNPPAWIEWMFYDHPAIMKRISAAEAGNKAG